MAKYYVESGAHQLVVQGDNPVRAALWAVHCWLRHITPNYEDAALSNEDRNHLARAEAARVLDGAVVVSQFEDGDTATHQLNTAALVEEWNQLMIALSRFESSVEQLDCCRAAKVTDDAA